MTHFFVIFYRLCLLFLLLSIGGCALFQPSIPRDTYELSSPLDFVDSSSTGKHILVRSPESLRSLDSDRLIIRRGGEITYLSGFQWSDRVPRMLQMKLVESFENSGYFGGVGISGDGLTFDYHLVMVLRRFEVSDGSARIEISAKLYDRLGSGIIASDVFEVSSIVGSGSSSYVSGFDAAFGELSQNLATWLRDNI